MTTSIRSDPGADISSDHDLVLCNLTLILCIKKSTVTNIIRVDLDKMENAITNIGIYRKTKQPWISHDMLYSKKQPNQILN